ncbi:MAG TPA: hypothetical protein VH374_12220 [Polyangia bacterium]|nr:hypothetical protein [Polyangia bacterium]
MRSFEKGRGTWIVVALLAVALVAILIGVVASGFRGRHVSRNAAALTEPRHNSPPPAVEPAARAPAPR